MNINTAPLTITTQLLDECIEKVRRGAALLDRKVPGWRRVMRKHEAQYKFESGEHCVLGTLEHYAGQMRVLRARTVDKEAPSGGYFGRASYRLRLNPTLLTHQPSVKTHGFCWGTAGGSNSPEAHILDALWRAEFKKQDPS